MFDLAAEICHPILRKKSLESFEAFMDEVWCYFMAKKFKFCPLKDSTHLAKVIDLHSTLQNDVSNFAFSCVLLKYCHSL